MEEKIEKILCEINEEISNYQGENYFEDGILDSLNFVDLVAELNDAFNIDIPTKYLTSDYFKSKTAILNLIKELVENK